MDKKLEIRIKTLENKLEILSDQLNRALVYIENDPQSSLTKSRTILEQILLNIYKLEMDQEPKRIELGAILTDNQFTRKIDKRIISRMNSIRDMCNLGVHGEKVVSNDAKIVLDNLCEVLEWYFDNYRTIKPEIEGPEDLGIKKLEKINEVKPILNKKQRIKIIAASLILLALIGVGYFFFIHKGLIGRSISYNNKELSEETKSEIAEKRLALIIGNSVYTNHLGLRCPVMDANLMETSLKNLRFDVIKYLNAGKVEVLNALSIIRDKVGQYNVVCFYYSGHGVQLDGIDYLVPIDAKGVDKTGLRAESVPIHYFLDEFEKYPDNVNIVILDACRNNPFNDSTKTSDLETRAVNFSSGIALTFSTSAGEIALDGKGENGLFTEELVKQIYVKQSVESALKKTRIEVKDRSNGLQIPEIYTRLNRDFYFLK
jgi:hypothetical protein